MKNNNIIGASAVLCKNVHEVIGKEPLLIAKSQEVKNGESTTREIGRKNPQV